MSDPEVTFIPAVKINTPIDPTGAGDAATAGAVLTLVAGGSHSEAALVGNLVASITVQQIGTTGTASPAMVSEMKAALKPVEATWIEKAKKKGVAQPEKLIEALHAELAAVKAGK